MTPAQRDFLRALRPDDSVRVRLYNTWSFIVCDRAGDPVTLARRGWTRRRWSVAMVDALERSGHLTTRGTRPKPNERRLVLTKLGREHCSTASQTPEGSNG